MLPKLETDVWLHKASTLWLDTGLLFLWFNHVAGFGELIPSGFFLGI